jgi:hypothetical protein
MLNDVLYLTLFEGSCCYLWDIDLSVIATGYSNEGLSFGMEWKGPVFWNWNLCWLICGESLRIGLNSRKLNLMKSNHDRPAVSVFGLGGR